MVWTKRSFQERFWIYAMSISVRFAAICTAIAARFVPLLLGFTIHTTVIWVRIFSGPVWTDCREHVSKTVPGQRPPVLSFESPFVGKVTQGKQEVWQKLCSSCGNKRKNTWNWKKEALWIVLIVWIHHPQARNSRGVLLHLTVRQAYHQGWKRYHDIISW